MKIYRGDDGPRPRSAGRDDPDHDARSRTDARTTLGHGSRPDPVWVTVGTTTREPVTGSTVTGVDVSIGEAEAVITVDEAGADVSVDEVEVVASVDGNDPSGGVDVATAGTAPQEGSNT